MGSQSYQQQAIAGMNSVELIVALYDGMVRFLRRAIDATETGNISDRRIAVKRVLDILMHLQSRLKMDAGGPAKSLSEFYAAIFALCLEGSRLSSVSRFHDAIRHILNVREAWQQVADDPEVRKQLATQAPARMVESTQQYREASVPHASSWTA